MEYLVERKEYKLLILHTGSTGILPLIPYYKYWNIISKMPFMWYAICLRSSWNNVIIFLCLLYLLFLCFAWTTNYFFLLARIMSITLFLTSPILRVCVNFIHERLATTDFWETFHDFSRCLSWDSKQSKSFFEFYKF